MCGKTSGNLRLRDRDAIVTQDNMIFRVYGYTHPPTAYICDPEYAPAPIYQSEYPKVFRTNGKEIYYKFLGNEGLLFVQKAYPHYTVKYTPLQKNLVGVKRAQIAEIRQPDKRLQSLILRTPQDLLLQAMHALVDNVQQRSSLSKEDFGVFGSLLHNFYHPRFSDIDLIIYGRANLEHLTEALATLYQEENSSLRNEFATMTSMKGKQWKFLNYSVKEYIWHQERKHVYALFNHEQSGRIIKAEFEPVKQWEEIRNEYSRQMQITPKGWIKMLARITCDHDSAFMPSVYEIEPIKILNRARARDIQQILSYMEEFRMQATRDEIVTVEGNLEQVRTPCRVFHQVTLTYCPRYYEQTLKLKN